MRKRVFPKGRHALEGGFRRPAAGSFRLRSKAFVPKGLRGNPSRRRLTNPPHLNGSARPSHVNGAARAKNGSFTRPKSGTFHLPKRDFRKFTGGPRRSV